MSFTLCLGLFILEAASGDGSDSCREDGRVYAVMIGIEAECSRRDLAALVAIAESTSC